MTYRSLDAEAIIATSARLHARICERFPGAGLSKVAAELLAEARETTARIADIRRPNWWIRGASAVAMLAMLGLLAALIASATAPTTRLELFPLLQVVESAINDVIFLGIAVFFLSTLETRIKRSKSLRALHQLRSLAHVIDMHQLTKDPEHLMSPERDTPSSPERRLDRFQLARYLDYCTELLAIISKIAALHAQDLDDPQVLGAVNDIQALSAGLSTNIGQKIVILDNLRMRSGDV